MARLRSLDHGGTSARFVTSQPKLAQLGGTSVYPFRLLALNRDYGYAVPMPSPVLDRADAVQRLSACEREIRALGVSRLALFGSVLHGRTRVDSDADLLVQFAPGAKTYDRFLALSELLERHLGRRVELMTTEALSPFIGPRILAEAIDVLRAA